MRQIERSTRFGKDFRRELKGRHGAVITSLLSQVLTLLTTDTALPEKFRDQALTGEWKQHRDCHLKPDLVLIYRLPDAHTSNLSGLVRIANLACSAGKLHNPFSDTIITHQLASNASGDPDL